MFFPIPILVVGPLESSISCVFHQAEGGGTEKKEDQEKRILSIFSIVSFSNFACQGTGCSIIKRPYMYAYF